MLAHIYYTVRLTATYTVDVPDGMDPSDVAQGLMENDEFYVHTLAPDLLDADWGNIDTEWDDWCDEVDVTQEQVHKYLGK